MVDIGQFDFSYEELLTLMVRHLELHEGVWTLNLQANLQGRNVRRSSENERVSPGFVFTLDKIGLIRATKSAPGLCVDAAKVNPRPKPAPAAPTSNKRRVN